MAGTFAEQAQLANDTTFIEKVRVAMILRAVELINSASAQNYRVLVQMNGIVNGGGSDAARMAALIVSGISTIGAAAPVHPTDAALQTAVNTVLTVLLK
jgi:hypothetical protein